MENCNKRKDGPRTSASRDSKHDYQVYVVLRQTVDEENGATEKKSKKRRKIKTKYLVIAVILMFFICAALVYPFFMVERPGVPHYQLTGFTSKQKDFVITTSWDKDSKCDSYTVIVVRDGKKKLHKTKHPYWKLKKVRPGEEYRLIIMGCRPWQGMSDPEKIELKGVKEYQKFETEDDLRAGFKGDKTSVKTKAVGRISYASLTPKTASVNQSGIVTFKAPGEVEIEITAAGTDLYRVTKEVINMQVFPKKLPAPTGLKIKETTGNTVTFEWQDSEYANKYKLYKEEYEGSEKFKEVSKDTDTLSATVTRDGGDYRVKALNSVNGQSVESPLSDSVFVEPASDSIPERKKLKTIAKFDNKNTKKITSLPNNGYTLQSMCITKDRYVIVYSSRNGKSGVMKTYDFKGKNKDTVSTGKIGHGNGCAYNPVTNGIYIVHGYAKSKSSTITRFSADTLKRDDEIKVSGHPSAIAFDPYNRCYYLKVGRKIVVAKEDFKELGKVELKRSEISQDFGAYNGLILVCSWNGGSIGYIDMYKAKNGDYIGSYETHFGELESVGVKDGKLVFIVNNGSNDGLYITKKRIEFE